MAGRVHNGLFVDYCAKDFLDATLHLDPWEELAYRRVVDMIYATNDALADDDKKLAWATKAGSRWPKIKASLVAAGKLELIDGRITNARCRRELEKTARKISQRSAAGTASAGARNALKSNHSLATDVATEQATKSQLTTNLPFTSEADASEATIKTAPLGQDPEPEMPQRQDPNALFGEWWQFVPRRVSKGQAEKAYRAALKHATPAELLAGIQRFAEQVQGEDPRFIAHPATWLNGKRWLDEPAPPQEIARHDRRSTDHRTPSPRSGNGFLSLRQQEPVGSSGSANNADAGRGNPTLDLEASCVRIE